MKQLITLVILCLFSTYSHAQTQSRLRETIYRIDSIQGQKEDINSILFSFKGNEISAVNNLSLECVHLSGNDRYADVTVMAVDTTLAFYTMKKHEGKIFIDNYFGDEETRMSLSGAHKNLHKFLVTIVEKQQHYIKLKISNVDNNPYYDDLSAPVFIWVRLPEVSDRALG